MCKGSEGHEQDLLRAWAYRSTNSNGGNMKEGRNAVGGLLRTTRPLAMVSATCTPNPALAGSPHTCAPHKSVCDKVSRRWVGKNGVVWGRVVENSYARDATGHPTSCLALLAMAIEGQLEVYLRNRVKTGTKFNHRRRSQN
jgi:hypothetical protein